MELSAEPALSLPAIWKVEVILKFSAGEVYVSHPQSFSKNLVTPELRIGSVLKENGSLFVELVQHFAAKVLLKSGGGDSANNF